MAKVSAVVLTKNEEVMLPRCLAALSWADEMLVVDSFSTDRTVDLAREAGARVLQHPFEGFASQFNWAANEAANDWVLLVDADEVVEPGLRNAVRAALDGTPSHEVYHVVRDSFVFGQRMKATSWSGELVPRLFKKGALTFKGVVHPEVDVGGRAVGRLEGRLLHYSYRSMEQYFEKFQLYTTLWARKAHDDGRRVGLPAILFSPMWRVFHNYFLRGEFRDGRLGLLLSLTAGAYTLVKYAKLWGLERESGRDGSAGPKR